MSATPAPASLRVVAIDGPSGSGKSTVARHLAERLGLEYLDTGAMYRGVAFACLRRNVDPEDAEPVTRVAEQIELSVERGVTTVDGVDASIEIRGPEVTRAVSAVAANPAVRSEMVRRQREWIVKHGGGVVEGRDIGAVVWPEAHPKVYLTARLAVRADRRHKEVEDLEFEAVAADMAARDTLDSTREASPLNRARDAVVIDTTDHTVDEVVDIVLGLLD
ncbi:MAG TPA: (d)CMP kinase [Acidimicrobiales bacterium]|nr:(d)CMP kinase [Acidimicrobiales bacterium]